jgi:diadenosine tetraphosphatase ApaH/serine/threonine PP2A family protein phosphatase
VYSRPESLEEFASQSSAPTALWDAVREMVGATRTLLGEDRISWLSRIPQVQIEHPIALVHAAPESCWRSPGPDASDTELESVYGPLDQAIAVYGHIHRSFIRRVPCMQNEVLHGQEMLVINTGSVSQSYDGDTRAAYLLLDEFRPTIRRVQYDLEKEIRALSSCGLPHSDWVIRILLSASPQMP